MYFDELIGLKERNGHATIVREAVRGISIKDNKILMIATNQGDYKLPGGGIKENENHKEALAREVAEETGYTCERISNLVGKVLERKIDKYEKDKIFEMISYYYFCEVSDSFVEQSLDEYEIGLGFKPVWISIQEAILKNIEFLSKNKNDSWTKRENLVLTMVNNIDISELKENMEEVQAI